MARELTEYRRKRDFTATPEPRPRAPRAGSKKKRTFVVQKHAASSLHYDTRLEIEGVLVSWAVPKGPSMDPSVKRLAVMTEDHPLSYGGFEGVIPRGHYGAGPVIVWDRGTWVNETEEDGRPVPAASALRSGHLRFRLEGKKLRGSFALRRWKGKQWLLVKVRDEEATSHDDLVRARPESVLTGRRIEDLAR